jgi:exosortase
MAVAGSLQGTRSRYRRRPFSQREWILAVGRAVAFVPGVLALAKVWFHVDYQSPGLLVPIVAWWAALRERPRWHDLPAEGVAWGLVPLIAGLSIYIGGLAAGIPAMAGLGMVAGVWGFVAYCRGTRWLRALAFSLSYLIFMVPVPPSIITPAIVKLQLFVSWLSIRLSEWVGITLTREGNVLTMPSGETLFVAEAGGGVTSLVTLLPIGVLLAYFSLRTTWAWILSIVEVVPIAMIGNLARVMSTILATDAWGAKAATEGLLHESAGLITYGVACFLLLSLGAWLRRAEACETNSWSSVPSSRP